MRLIAESEGESDTDREMKRSEGRQRDARVDRDTKVDRQTIRVEKTEGIQRYRKADM